MLKNWKHEKEFDTQTLFTDIGSPVEDATETTDRKALTNSEMAASADLKTQKYEPRPLTPEDDIYEDIIEQFASAPTKPKYWFEEFGDYWSCSCGHINKGDTCKSCGLERELLRSLFILHKPAGARGKSDIKIRLARNKQQADKEDEHQAERENRMKQREESGEDMTKVVPIEESVPDTKKSKPEKNPAAFNRKIIMAIAACVALILAGCAGIYLYMSSTQQEEATQRFRTGAIVLENLPAHAVSLFPEDMTAFTKAVNSGKFAYVQEHLSEGDPQAETYLAQLMAAKYPGIQEIYDEYYAWDVDMVANTSEDDFSTDMDTVSRKDTVYFHATLSGGKPDEIIELYYEVTWPNGSSEIYGLDSLWQAGSRITARFQYPIPLFGAEGKLTFNLYNKNTKELIGTDTVTFKN